jgi:hypothetical protein
MAFKDLADFLVVEPVVLPIRGKAYAFPGSVSARLWLQLNVIKEQLELAARAEAEGEDFEPDREAISDETEGEMMAEMFGGVDAEMVADGCSSAELDRVKHTLIAFHLSGGNLTAAEAVWEQSGKAPAPNREARRKKTSVKPAPPAPSLASSSEPRESAETAQPGELSLATGS